MALINLTSAIILILLGMRYLRKGLDRLFGNQLVDWLQSTAENRRRRNLAFFERYRHAFGSDAEPDRFNRRANVSGTTWS
jgi:hypothetical protein